MYHKQLYSTVFSIVLCGLFYSQILSAQPISQPDQTTTLFPARLAEAENKLLGKHMFSLQWISWEKFGTAVVKRRDKGLEIEAKQELNGNFATLKGTIEIIDERAFNFTGEVETRIDHINNGIACKREGTFEFRATGTRKYWRMQQMNNPCDPVIDYIDVYF